MTLRCLCATILVPLGLAAFTDRAGGQVSVIGDLSQDHNAVAGEHYAGSISVRNDSNEPQEVKVYQTDYSFTADGTSAYGSAGSLARSNARWVKFSPATTVIPPHASVNVNFTVDVPAASPEPVGSYWSMLMVEGIPAGSPESSRRENPKQPEMGLRQTLRYGIQIATHIIGGGTKGVKFLHSQLQTGQAGERVLTVDIENSGTLWIKPDVTVELFDNKGESKGKFPGTLFRIYPGTSVRQSITLGVLPPGEYKALVVVDAGGDDVFGAQFTFSI
jgi:hypothetical protein